MCAMSRRPQKKLRRRPARRRGLLYLLRRRWSKRVANKKPLKPSDLRRRNQIRRRNALILKIILLVLLLGGFFFAVWKLARLDKFLIQKIDIRGVEVLEEEEVRGVVEEMMGGSVALFFPRQNSFFVPVSKIESKLKDDFIVVNQTNILRKGLDELVVVIQERQPVTIFCGEESEQIGECYFADKAGVMYRTVPHIARSQFPLIYFESENKEEERFGEKLLNEKQLEALSSLVEMLLKEGDIGVNKITLMTGESFRLETNKDYSIVVSVKEDYLNDVSRLLTALRADVLREDEALGIVEEFDLRYGRKVFYTIQEKEVAEPTITEYIEEVVDEGGVDEGEESEPEEEE